MVGGHVLEQEAARADRQRRVDVPVKVERGKHEHPATRVALQDPPGRLQAVHRRHPDIHEHDVGFQRECRGHRRRSVGRLAGHLDAARGQDHAEPGTDQLLVVDDQHARRPGGRLVRAIHGGSTGMRARTR
jgi:hypothetical protein